MNPALDLSAVLLDAPAMGERLRRSFANLREGDDFGECRIHQSRRRISRKTEETGAPYLGVLYELTSRAHAPTPVARWCYVKAFSRGASRSAPDAQSAVRLEDLDALAWQLPHDPAMPHLAAFLDPQHVRGELRRLVGAGDDGSMVCGVSVVRHEPESHCTARFELALHGRRQAIYGKSYTGDAWRDAARHLDALHAASRAADAFAVARPLGTSAALNAVWQHEVRGDALRMRLGGAQAATWLARVAAAVKRLQAMPVAGVPALAPAALFARCAKQGAKLLRADATLAGALAPVLGRLERSAPQLTGFVLAHGDLHADQMRCDGERVVLFDFDNIVAGSAALDAADFTSQLLTDHALCATSRRELAAAFAGVWRTGLPQPALRREFDWYLRALLLRKAYSFFVRHRSGWRLRALETLLLAGAAAPAGLPDPS